jgi:alkanesulfonate monooxygenase SsuD/methylene tetrahydromethanopterin reductase-like flavin-dependent oxidoreductase (luciferase family)
MMEGCTVSRMIMGLFIGYGHGPRGWDDPGLRSDYDWRRPELYQDLARVCERGIFDLMVFADVLGIPEAFRGSQDTSIRYGLEGICHDPIPLIAMIAAKTEKIGLASTLSTTLYPPFLLARLMSTLDHLTRGRIGWNVVTSSNQSSAKNFGQERLPQHDDRYDIAEEYMDLCYRLWSSWDPDALIVPHDDFLFADPAKVHRINFASEHFRCQGPLTTTPSPQGRPVIVQAGASDRGREFAARHAELVICSKESLDDMKATREDIKTRLIHHGRKESDCGVSRSDRGTVHCIPSVVHPIARAGAAGAIRPAPTSMVSRSEPHRHRAKGASSAAKEASLREPTFRRSVGFARKRHGGATRDQPPVRHETTCPKLHHPMDGSDSARRRGRLWPYFSGHLCPRERCDRRSARRDGNPRSRNETGRAASRDDDRAACFP